MRVFLDANILFSAAHRDRSELLVFFELARAGVIQLVSSALAIEEGRRNVAVKRPDRIAAYEGLMADLEASPAPSNEHFAIAQAAGMPPKDAPILAAAFAAEADLLVTGDRAHFGHLFGRSIGRLLVQRPTQALSAILLDAKRARAPRDNS